MCEQQSLRLAPIQFGSISLYFKLYDWFCKKVPYDMNRKDSD